MLRKNQEETTVMLLHQPRKVKWLTGEEFKHQAKQITREIRDVPCQ